MAARKYKDNVPEEIKQRRLSEIINLQLKHSFENLSTYIDKYSNVLVEKESKKSKDYWCGRNPQNIMVVFPKDGYKIGDYAKVKILGNTSTTLIGEAIKK